MSHSRRPRGGRDRFVAIRMPLIDPEVGTYTFLRWLIAEGDDVRVDQDLSELVGGTEVFYLPSPLDGVVLELCVATDDPVAPGDILAWIEES